MLLMKPKQNTRPRGAQQAIGPIALSVTSGRDTIGRIIDRHGQCTAFAADGRELGEFASRKAACVAINAAITELR
jgi:hypothetical protein